MLNALGFGLCIAAIGLLLVRNRIIASEADLQRRKSRLDAFFLGRYWLDLGMGGLAFGLLCQVVAWILWGT